MKVNETKLKGCFILEPTLFHDERGFFYESFNSDKFNKAIGLEVNFVQDNHSFSYKGVARAIHYQTGKFAQAKLVRVLSGSVLDVAVDLRKESPTFGEYISIELSSENRKQFFIPKGFGHGFIVLSETADFLYKCDNYYNKDSEGGIIYNDPSINIDWQVPHNQIIISERDAMLPTLDKAIL